MRTTVLLVRVCWLTLGTTLGVLAPATAQSLTHGALRGVVLSAEDGAPIMGVQVTLESPDGHALQYLESDGAGRFQVPLLSPGVYQLLAEQVGLQPVRVRGVVVAGGQTAVVSIRLERRPPPIERVVEVQHGGITAGTTMGRSIGRSGLSFGDRHLAVSDLGRGLTEFDSPRDAREGLAVAGGGLGASSARLLVDAIPEALVRHPGVPAEPASAPLFARGALDQAQVLALGSDVEWRGTQGAALAAYSRRGGSALSFHPYFLASSATMGGAAEDNPADSSATSFLAGASLSGPIIRDTASFHLRVDYRRDQTPSAWPWEQDRAMYQGAEVSLREQLPVLAQQPAVAAGVAPTVRRWTGVSSLGRLDWRLGDNDLFARVGFARWTEENPLLLSERSNLSGVELEASDLSIGLGVTSDFGSAANEVRAGFTKSRREWSGSTMPATRLAAEGVAFGGSPALPALFDRRSVELSNAFQVVAGQHRFKLGVSVGVVDHEQDYRYGSGGIFTFGSLDSFDGGVGTFYQTTGPDRTADPRILELGFFAQNTWTVSPEFSLLAGVRWDRQQLPQNKVTFNQGWFALTGQRNDNVPSRAAFSPRVGFVWDVQSRGQWVVRGGGGLFQGQVDPALLAEAMLLDGSVTVRRGQGIFNAWPALPGPAQAATVGPALTFLNETFRAPRTFKGGLTVSRALGNAVAVHLSGAYHHTDYLPRRTDLNRAPVASGATHEGRPVYGALVQQGGLVTAAPGTSRRFGTFDMVTGIAPTGYADYYEFTALVERPVTRGLSLAASYTFSSTRDNVAGALSLDPADQLDPFAGGLGGQDWTDGVSDFDVPHRVGLSAELRLGGRAPLTLGGRWRYRSGFPFTPGFRPGVDLNGDGSGGNDPAFLDSGLGDVPGALGRARCTGGLNAFAERNSCREEPAHGLDLRLTIGLPLGGGMPLALTVDAFNVVSSAVGVVDRALLLVDPNGALSTDSQGRVTVPLLLNPDFGSLASRRNDPRLIRVGLRMEY